MRADVYSPPAVVDPNIKPATPSDGGVDGVSIEQKKRIKDKKGDDDDVSLSGKWKKKRKRSSE